ncbi:MAG: sigma-70 family RNA polymerase sigma factor [Clostridia bacterium]|nr:sigma-70 family RNA polymerase sigma factor [Clostridia bacterium]
MTDLIYSDAKLLALLRERDETALSVIQRQYGRKALHLANRILDSEFDAEECVNDALLDIWNTVPPTEPSSFLSYFCLLVRRRAIDRVRYRTAERRAGGEYAGSLEELESVLPAMPDEGDGVEIMDCIQSFLDTLSPCDRRIFLLRYFRFCSHKEIGDCVGMREGTVNMRLTRLRKKLKEALDKRGIPL